uniref:DNA binding protein hu-like protein histon like protein n=1 Tax=Cryptomonas curvata TaxID=233186 RepID=A0A222AHG3_9CRYP|nr:DNA binding protein hu-like protein histon like protein [Cryptomonas curvata]ASO75808.1 DNA binding protein hu-like protein histon like protein [Cryptomonas curvata]
MNKKELIDTVFHDTDITKKEIDLVLTKVLETIMDRVSNGEKVQLVGFGSFSCVKRKLSIVSNIATHSHRAYNPCIKFSAGKFFKEKVNIS